MSASDAAVIASSLLIALAPGVLAVWIPCVILSCFAAHEKQREMTDAIIRTLIFGPLGLLYELLAPSYRPIPVYLVDKPPPARVEHPPKVVSFGEAKPPPVPELAGRESNGPPGESNGQQAEPRQCEVTAAVKLAMLLVSCPCGQRFKAPVEAVGRSVTCKRCGERFVITADRVHYE